MNIYFSFSITGGREFQPVLQAMAQQMLAAGCDVPTAMNTCENIDPAERQRSAQEIYRRDIAWIDACDMVVAEVSTPSHGVGYEIAYALMQNKPVHCFYRSDVVISKMISGNDDDKLHVAGYTDLDDLRHALQGLIVNCRPD